MKSAMRPCAPERSRTPADGRGPAPARRRRRLYLGDRQQGGGRPEPYYVDAVMLAPGIACTEEPLESVTSGTAQPYWQRRHDGAPDTWLTTKALQKTVLPVAEALRRARGREKDRRPAGGLSFTGYAAQLVDQLGQVPTGRALTGAVSKLLPVPTPPGGGHDGGFRELDPAGGPPRPAGDIRVLIANAGRDIRSTAVVPQDAEAARDGRGSCAVIGLPYATVLQLGGVTDAFLWSPVVMLASLLCHATHMLAGAYDTSPVTVPRTLTPGAFGTYATTRSAAIALGDETALRHALLGASGVSFLHADSFLQLPAFEAASRTARAFRDALPAEAAGLAKTYDETAVTRNTVWRLNEAAVAREFGYKPRKSHEQSGQRDYSQRTLLVEPRELVRDKNLVDSPYSAWVKGKVGAPHAFSGLKDSWERWWESAMYLDYLFSPVKATVNAFTGGAVPSVVVNPVKNLYRLANAGRMVAHYAGAEKPAEVDKAPLHAAEGTLNRLPVRYDAYTQAVDTTSVDRLLQAVRDVKDAQAAVAGGLPPAYMREQRLHTPGEAAGWAAKKVVVPAVLEMTPYVSTAATGLRIATPHVVAAVPRERRDAARRFVREAYLRS
ncbi:hypothetical protein ACFY2W_15795 [Streptomyces sp. NPDC001262]|uniref:hypothetical protein n=1 Tax=Streptomyces sp. NPDC001262 TaxID=3364552 RepID=UPI00368BBE7F